MLLENPTFKVGNNKGESEREAELAAMVEQA